MERRQLTPLDRLLASAGNALRTVVAPAGRAARANPAEHIIDADLDDREKAHAAGLMRVNHAGEVCAQALYQGHAAVARDKSIEEQMQRAADEEFDHLAWCEQRIGELKSQITEKSRQLRELHKAGQESSRSALTLEYDINLLRLEVASRESDDLRHAQEIRGLGCLAIGQQGQEPGQFWLPNGIFISGDNTIYVADSRNKRVQVFRYVGLEE